MPEISRFFGIVIRMFVEPGEPHQRPHFHAYYSGDVGVYAVDAVERIAGLLPVPQDRMVLAWAEIHREALLENWQLLQSGRLPKKVPPLS
ncbi:MAG: DUF4160 domain-containing protein [Gemmatimonadetes bacterium]|nr:DUF4160 domain-containing protein [Gemmatimonadota bacterium]